MNGGSSPLEPGTPAPGTGFPAQGVVGVFLRAHGEAALSYKWVHRPGSDGDSSSTGGRSILQGLWGGGHRPRTGWTSLGGMGSPAQGLVGVFFRAHGEAASS